MRKPSSTFSDRTWVGLTLTTFPLKSEKLWWEVYENVMIGRDGGNLLASPQF